MVTTNLITNVNRGLERIENHIRGVGTPMQNPANIIDGIRGSLNTIRVTLQLSVINIRTYYIIQFSE